MPDRPMNNGDIYINVTDDLFYGVDYGTTFSTSGLEASAALSIAGDYFVGTFQADELDWHQFVLTGTLAGLEIARRVYVPDANGGEAGEGWARFLDSFTNSTGAAISVQVVIANNYASGASTYVLDTSSGNQLVGTDDNWVLTNNVDGNRVVQLFGDGTRAPDDIDTAVHLFEGDQGLGLTYELTINPGETVSLLYFVATPSNATETYEELDGLAALDTSAILGLTAAQLGSVVNWDTANNRAQSETVIGTFTDGPGYGGVANWGDRSGGGFGGFIGQSFVAAGSSLEELRFRYAAFGPTGTDYTGVTDYRIDIVEWNDGTIGDIVGQTGLLSIDFGTDEEIVTVDMGGIALVEGHTYAFILNHAYGSDSAGSGDISSEDGSAYADGIRFTGVQSAPGDYGSYVPTANLDLQFRLVFGGGGSSGGPAEVPPVAADPVPDVVRTEDQFLNYTIPAGTFTDANGDDLTYSVTLASGDPLPSWLVFVPSSRLLSGQPPADFSGTLHLRVIASDGTGSASDDFDLTFTPVNDAPYVFDPIADQSATEGTAYSFSFSPEAFADVDGPALTYTATLDSLAALPAWLVFDPATRTFSGTPPANAHGAYDIRVNASDGSLSAHDVFTLTVAAAGTPTPTGPVAHNDIFYTTETEAVRANVLSNNGAGYDEANGSELVVSAVNGSPGNVGTNVFLPSGSQIFLQQNGVLDYIPSVSLASLGAGAVVTESFSYTLAGGTSAQVTIVVYGIDGEETLRGGPGPDRLDGGYYDDVLIGGPGPDVLIGGPGNDTASYEFDVGAIFVNLTLGRGYGNAAEGDTYFGIENVTGTAFNDFIIGNEGENTLDGGPGNDTLIGGLGPDHLIGGDGIDTASYEDNSGAVFVSLATGRGFGNAAEGDTYEGIENVRGGIFDDYLIGSDGPNTLDGGPGNDYLMGGLGPDHLIGGEGNDTVSYADNYGSVFVNLATGRGYNNAAEGDTYEGVENVVGSSYRDVLIGNGEANRLDGGPGFDELSGGGGADTFVFSWPAESPFAGDYVTDFVSGTDRIELSQLAFPGLALGPLDPGVFFINDGEHGTKGPEDRLIFTPAVFPGSPGLLFYDADGSGPELPLMVASFENGLLDLFYDPAKGNVQATDIFVV